MSYPPAPVVRALLIALCGFSLGAGLPPAEPAPFVARPFAVWSPQPPRGWNSYDAYHAAITESQFKAVVDVLAEKMLPHGYEYAVMDYMWFHPGPAGWDPDHRWHTWQPNQRRDPATGLLMPQLRVDEFGRPIPALNRFPSAANGVGLKAIADYTHAKGLKFGLHIMRGIPTQSVEANLPVRGTPYRMQDIAETGDTSSFQGGIFTGVNVDHPGAQAYYDDLFQMYADWGVDFIKADDMLRPAYHEREIAMMRRAIDKTGRPMVFSLSYGEVSPGRAAHLVANANMWRVSADFWDRWADLRRNFDLLDAWSPFIGRGTWPDADMIPIGKLMLTGWEFAGAENLNRTKGRNERHDNFTPAERRTLMTLWCIARSPLMWGGDPLTSDEATYALLTNSEVLAVNAHGSNPRQVVGNNHKDDSLRVWVSDVPDSSARYVALFNLRDTEASVSFDLIAEEMRGLWQVRNLWTRAGEDPVEGRLTRLLPPHGSALFKLSR
jgi:alpha-galactosidase